MHKYIKLLWVTKTDSCSTFPLYISVCFYWHHLKSGSHLPKKIFALIIGLQKWWKMFFTSSEKLFLFSIRSISPYSVRMLENKDQSNSEYGHFSRSAVCAFYKHSFTPLKCLESEEILVRLQNLVLQKFEELRISKFVVYFNINFLRICYYHGCIKSIS